MNSIKFSGVKHGAVDCETRGSDVPVADLVVNDRVRRAPSFESRRISAVHGQRATPSAAPKAATNLVTATFTPFPRLLLILLLSHNSSYHFHAAELQCFPEMGEVNRLKWLAAITSIMLLSNFLSAQDSEPQKLCTMQGQVVEEPGGGPVRKAEIRLVSAGAQDRATYTAVSGADGRFKLEKIRPGTYMFEAKHNGLLASDKRHRWFWGHTISLSPGEDMKDLLVRMRPSAVIAGKILDGEGDPMDQVSVYLDRYPLAKRRRFWGPVHTNDLGEYRIGNLEPGRYIVSAVAPRNYADEWDAQPVNGNKTRKSRAYTTYYPGVIGKSGAIPVQVRVGDEMPINLTMQFGPAFHVRGKISGFTENEDAYTELVLVQKDSPTWSTLAARDIKADGTFEIDGIPPGQYRLALTTRINDTLQATHLANLEIKDTDIEDFRVTTDVVSTVSGRLHGEGDGNIEWRGFVVALKSDEARSYVWDWLVHGTPLIGDVKRDGSFEIKSVPAGAYRVEVASLAGSRATQLDYFMKAATIAGKDVVDSGFTVSGGKYFVDILASAKSARVEGTVTDGSHAIADAIVVAVPDGADPQDTYRTRSTTTDQRGHFEFRGVRPGAYTLLAVEDPDEDYRETEFLTSHKDQAQSLHLQESDAKTLQLRVIPAQQD